MGSRNVNSRETSSGGFRVCYTKLRKTTNSHVHKKKKQKLKNIRNLNASRPRLIYNVIEMKQYLVNLCKYHSRK